VDTLLPGTKKLTKQKADRDDRSNNFNRRYDASKCFVQCFAVFHTLTFLES